MSNKDDVQNLIREYNRRLQKLREQEAKFGAHTPPHILTEIEDIEAKLEKLQSELADLEASDKPSPSRATIPAKTSQDSDSSNKPLSFRNILAGIIVTVVGGIILTFIIQEGRFAPNSTPSFPTVTNTPTDMPTSTPIYTLTPIPSPTQNPTDTSTPVPPTLTSTPKLTPTPRPQIVTPTLANTPTPAIPPGKGILLFTNRNNDELIVDIIGPIVATVIIPPNTQHKFILDPGEYQCNSHTPRGSSWRFGFKILEGQISTESMPPW